RPPDAGRRRSEAAARVRAAGGATGPPRRVLVQGPAGEGGCDPGPGGGSSLMGFVGRGRLGRTIALGIAGALALAAARAPAAQGGELADLVERALREERRASAAPLPTREEVA